jgi:hypothetical protein
VLFRSWLREHQGLEDDGPRLVYKVVQLADTGGRRAMRCWLPRASAPPDGISEGAWAAESVNAFEDTLRGYLRDISGNRADDPT